MYLTNEQIVWTPILGPDSVAVALQRTFAEACMARQYNGKEFVEAVWRFMGNKPPVVPSNFLDLVKGILPKGFYAGHDGIWLTLDQSSLSGPPECPLMYYGHNENRRAVDRMWLLQAFAAWANAATALLELK